MFEALRDASAWCRAGAILGALCGVALPMFHRADPLGYIIAPAAFGLVGAAAGFIGATFFYAMRRRGLRPLAKAALQSAAGSLYLVPVARLLGWSSNQPLVTEMAAAILVLGFVGAYFDAAEIWIPKKTDENARGLS